MSLNISFNKIPTNKSETTLPEKTEGFLFLSITDINSFLFLGGTTLENYGLYLFDLNTNSWSNPKLNGEIAARQRRRGMKMPSICCGPVTAWP